ncbi:hypothetical protein OP10G_4691 [Fimbriimonas ginsengisoli Gsoil 348]|uniref:Uncharacterized protein n=1 Tax=Fimbriimonas ginsengisoli Gsoil 348 TaxID=661478 RepID=A0A068NZ70_FIMGI|nr:hypothetical protein OP10G_4691 [Fimbriimonas ginsengisoli Gsoil 348]
MKVPQVASAPSPMMRTYVRRWPLWRPALPDSLTPNPSPSFGTMHPKEGEGAPER